MIPRAVCAVVALVSCALALLVGRDDGPAFAAPEYWVSATRGDDGNDGTAERPWRTISHALASVSDGGAITVESGVYAEQVVIPQSAMTATTPLVLRAEEASGAVIDGSRITPDGALPGLVHVTSPRNLVIEGFTIRNLRTANRRRLVAGVYVDNGLGTGENVELRRLVVHDIRNYGKGGGQGHGIAVYGNHAAALRDVRVIGCEVRDCRLGGSEALVLNGNVDGFVVAQNVVRDNDNIGIDLIGFEGTAPSDDQVRGGVVSDNVVLRNSSKDNPTYRGEQSAGGIYVDGGRDIVIERNRVSACDIGIEVASEHGGRTTERVIVRSNVITHCALTGIAFGGFSPRRGETVDCVFENNTLVHNDQTRSGSGEILLQKAHGNRVRHNVVVAHEQNLFVSGEFRARDTFGNTFDRNCWFGPGGASGAIFVFERAAHEGFDAMRQATGQSANGMFVDPRLTRLDADDVDARPLAGSPVVDAGDPAFEPDVGELDALRLSRVAGARVDLGAHEVGAAAPALDPVRIGGPAVIEIVEGRAVSFEPVAWGAGPIQLGLASDGLPPGVVIEDGRRLTGVPTAPPTGTLEIRGSNAFGETVVTRAFRFVSVGSGDRDGDMFPNDLEDLLGADADDAGSAPFGPGSDVAELSVERLRAALGAPDRARDTLSLGVTLPDAAAIDVNGAEVLVYVGGVSGAFTLDARGRSPRGARAGRVRVRHKSAGTTLTWTLQRADLATQLADEGVSIWTESETADLDVFVVLDGRPFRGRVATRLRVRPGQRVKVR